MNKIKLSIYDLCVVSNYVRDKVSYLNLMCVNTKFKKLNKYFNQFKANPPFDENTNVTSGKAINKLFTTEYKPYKPKKYVIYFKYLNGEYKLELHDNDHISCRKLEDPVLRDRGLTRLVFFSIFEHEGELTRLQCFMKYEATLQLKLMTKEQAFKVLKRDLDPHNFNFMMLDSV